MPNALQAASNIRTRDQWLTDFVVLARPYFSRAGKPLPERIRAAMCPPHRARQRTIGLCWSDAVTEDNGREIWVTSAETDPVRVAGILVHELCHAALPHAVKHGKPFRLLAEALGLEGRMTATTEGARFKALWAPLLASLGPLPAARFTAGVAVDARVQRTPRMKNASCPHCGFTAMVRLDQLELGRLECPQHAGQLLLFKGEEGWVYR